MNPNKNRQRGKRTEKIVAKRLGGKRVGILGKEDVSHPIFSIECKSVSRFVGEKWFMQAIRNCEQGKIPAVVVHLVGQHYKNDYVIIRMKDFEDLLGRIK
jgi:hypothetical protein